MLVRALRCSRLLLRSGPPRRGRLLARHQRSLLLEWTAEGESARELCWLLDPGLGLSPRACSCPPLRLEVDCSPTLRWQGTRLELGSGLALELDGAELWEPLWQPRGHRRRAMSAPIGSLSSVIQPVADGLGGGPPRRAALVALLGLGLGSTPEGDDLLIGLRAAWQLRRHLGDEVPLGLVDEVLAEAGPADTHPVSLQGLHDARAGFYPEALARCLDALSGEGDLEPSLGALLALGGSSGRALGFGVWRGWTWP